MNRRLLRSFSTSKSTTEKIRFEMSSYSNITDKIMELTDRKLWHVENHPLQTLALR
jgi:hypothetical protein